MGETQAGGFDRNAGFGNFTVTTSGDGDAGVNVCLDNIELSVGMDAAVVTCIPTAGQWGLIIFAISLSSLGLIAIREEKTLFAFE